MEFYGCTIICARKWGKVMDIEMGRDFDAERLINPHLDLADHSKDPEYEKVFDIDYDKFEPLRGDILKVKTVKGGFSYIVYLCKKDEWAVYAHGDKARKINFHDFMKRLQHGDAEFVGNVKDPDITERFDVQRLTLMSVGLASLGKGESVDEHLNQLENAYEGKLKGVQVEEKAFDRSMTKKLT